ncbi:hypothetical protein LWI29_023985 [Acer saccharum]|uniref:Uncharacterized protein n=2 Tax=Acereae TaxID=1977919 RepID=A0AA39VX75_ACESA|nr:hypothetical protein LWI29_023985 [Acer saccharum]
MPWVPPSPMAHFGLAWASRVHTLASAWASRVHTLASAWAAVCTLWPRHGQPCAHFGLGTGSRVHTLASAWASRVHTLALAWAAVCTIWPWHGQPCAHFGLGMGKPCAHFGLGMGSRVHTLALAWASRVHTLALAWASRVHILALAWADFGLGVLILALAVQLKKLVVGPWVGSTGPPRGVHRSARPFCRRCAPGLNWPGRASGAVTLKKLECSKQAYALDTLAWDNIIGFRRTTAKAFAKDVFINQERKLGARRRSDTVLVSTINDADQGSADVTFRTPLAPYEKSKSLGSGGSMVARLKLKGIDGRAPPGVEPAA